MTKPDLSIIEVKKDESAPVTAGNRTLPYSFSLKVLLANPNAAVGAGEAGAPATIDPAAAPPPADAAAPVQGTSPPPAGPAASPAPAGAESQPPEPAVQTEGRPAS